MGSRLIQLLYVSVCKALKSTTEDKRMKQETGEKQFKDFIFFETVLSGCAYSPRGADSAIFSQGTVSVFTSTDEMSKNDDRERPLMMNKAGKRKGMVPFLLLLSQKLTEEAVRQSLDIISCIEMHGPIMVPCHRQFVSLIKTFHPPLGFAVGHPHFVLWHV